MAKVSAEERKEIEEEVEYFEETHAKEPAPKKHAPEPDYEHEQRQHEKKERRARETVASDDREEILEEVEYHETHHQAPREHTGHADTIVFFPDYESKQPGHGVSNRLSPFEITEYTGELAYMEQVHGVGKGHGKNKPAPDYEIHQPGHGGSIFLSPFEISQYNEEIEYHEKNSPSRKERTPWSDLELGAMEVAFVRHGESRQIRNLPAGMLGYDIETDYFHNVAQHDNRMVNPRGMTMFGVPIGPERSRGRMVTDAMRHTVDAALLFRDNLYGYRRIPVGPMTNAWRLDRGSVRNSRVGDIRFFGDRGGGRLVSMDPFGLSGHREGRIGKKKRGRPSNRNSDGGAMGGIPASLAWMF